MIFLIFTKSEKERLKLFDNDIKRIYNYRNKEAWKWVEVK